MKTAEMIKQLREMGDPGTFFADVADRLEGLHVCQHPPLERLEGTKPVVLFFTNDAEVEEFIRIVLEAKPNLRATSL